MIEYNIHRKKEVKLHPKPVAIYFLFPQTKIRLKSDKNLQARKSVSLGMVRVYVFGICDSYCVFHN